MNRLLELIRLSLFEPKLAAQHILELNWSISVSFQILIAAACASTFLIFAPDLSLVDELQQQGVHHTPVTFVITILVSSVVAVFLITKIGQFFNGFGNFSAVFSVVSWLQVVQVALQIPIVFLMVVSVGFASIFQIIFVLIGLWIFFHFVNAVHKFENLFKSAALIFMASIVSAFIATWVVDILV